VDTIVDDAQHDILRRAHPPTVITEEDAAALAVGYPQLLATLNLDTDTIAELVSGTRDVFTAACGDQLSGLHGPKGKPYPARPWVCLLCPLAVFAPRHLAKPAQVEGVLLAAVAADARRPVPGRLRPLRRRLDQILDRFDAAEVTAAAATVHDSDEEIPLRPEERTA
jgi:hypothetical protein